MSKASEQESEAEWAKGMWLVKQPGEHSPTELRVVELIGYDYATKKEISGAVCTISVSKRIDEPSPSAVMQQRANLIAAAPEMLEALEALVSCNLDHPGGSCNHVEQAEKAIRKAKGNQ
jgi:hypothetical protein